MKTNHAKQATHRKICHIIDNETYHRNVIAEVFKSSGYQVRSFKSVKHYLHYLNSPGYQTPDALIADKMTTRLQGYELSFRIHQKGWKQPLTLMTSFDDYRYLKKIAGKLSFILTTAFLQKNGY